MGASDDEKNPKWRQARPSTQKCVASASKERCAHGCLNAPVRLDQPERLPHTPPPFLSEPRCALPPFSPRCSSCLPARLHPPGRSPRSIRARPATRAGERWIRAPVAAGEIPRCRLIRPQTRLPILRQTQRQTRRSIRPRTGRAEIPQMPPPTVQAPGRAARTSRFAPPVRSGPWTLSGSSMPRRAWAMRLTGWRRS